MIELFIFLYYARCKLLEIWEISVDYCLQC